MLRQLQEEFGAVDQDSLFTRPQPSNRLVTDNEDEISLNFDEIESRQGPMKPNDGFEISDESDINAMDFDDEDENLASNYDLVS
jgi:hypothetical protein